MPKFYMDDAEITREYRTAKNKQHQVTVLAELNAVSVGDMRDKLKELGLVGDAKGRHHRQTIDFSRAKEMYDEGKSDGEIA